MSAYRQPDRSSQSPLVYDYAIAVERQRRQARISAVLLVAGAIGYAGLAILTGSAWPW
jgi:hypothetical protein